MHRVTNGNHDSTVNVASQPRTFIDLFAGCGGLSLGLMQAGWQGLFAVERSLDAFKTLSHNLISDNPGRPFCNGFAWPSWLPRNLLKSATFFLNTPRTVRSSRNGDPRCWGRPVRVFHLRGAGRLTIHATNFSRDIWTSSIYEAKIVFSKRPRDQHRAREEAVARKWPTRPTTQELCREDQTLLDQHGYEPQQVLVRACDFGVPQYRPRYLTVGIARLACRQTAPNFLETLMTVRDGFLKARGLPLDGYVNVAQAISDLCVTGKTQLSVMTLSLLTDFSKSRMSP